MSLNLLQTLVSGDPGRDTCESAFGQTVWSHPTANFVDSSLAWHHLAVTWTAKNGTTKVYKDGLLVKEVCSCDLSPACLQADLHKLDPS